MFLFELAAFSSEEFSVFVGLKDIKELKVLSFLAKAMRGAKLI
jgi:hypothetical protein